MVIWSPVFYKFFSGLPGLNQNDSGKILVFPRLFWFTGIFFVRVCLINRKNWIKKGKENKPQKKQLETNSVTVFAYMCPTEAKKTISQQLSPDLAREKPTETAKIRKIKRKDHKKKSCFSYYHFHGREIKSTKLDKQKRAEKNYHKPIVF